MINSQTIMAPVKTSISSPDESETTVSAPQSKTRACDVTSDHFAKLFQPMGNGPHVDETEIFKHGGFHRGQQLITDKMLETPVYVKRRHRHSLFFQDCDHPLHDLVHNVACGRDTGDTMSSGWWRKAMTINAILWGNGVSYIDREPDGTPKGLYILPPGRTYLLYENYAEPLKLINGGVVKRQKYYVCNVGGKMIRIRPENIFHIKNMIVNDPDWSPGVVRFLRDTAGVGLSAQQYAVKFFHQGMNISGILMMPGHLDFADETEKQEVVDKIRSKYEGMNNANKTLVLEEGWRFMQTSMANDAAQFLESRKFSNSDVGNFLRLSGGLLGGDVPYSYNSAEMMRQSMREDGLEFWFSQFEDEYCVKILDPSESRTSTTKIGFDRDNGLALPFMEKVNGYGQMYRDGAITKAQYLDRMGMPFCAEDDKYFDGEPANCDDCAAETNENIDFIEPAMIGRNQAIIDGTWRGLRRVTSELKDASESGKKLFAFFDRREQVEMNFSKTLKPLSGIFGEAVTNKIASHATNQIMAAVSMAMDSTDWKDYTPDAALKIYESWNKKSVAIEIAESALKEMGSDEKK